MLPNCSSNRVMRVYDVVSTGFTISVGCFLFFLGYVHLTSPNVNLHRGSYPDHEKNGAKDVQRLRSDFLKNLNESIKRMDYDREYAGSNITNRDPIGTENLDQEEDEKGEHPLFVDVVKVSRLVGRREGLPDATDHHDLSGYVSMLHPDESHLELNCKTCSLVCSSGHLLHSKLGRTIDSADCVFRTNDAPTRGYTRDVGSRTTLRMVGFPAMPKVLEGRVTLLVGSARPRYLVMWGPEREVATNGSGRGYNHLRALSMMLEGGGTDAYILGPGEMSYNNRLYEAETGQNRSKSGSWLTTGWFTMVLARSVCGEIHVYGMVGENYCRHDHGRKVPYHYYNPHSQDECEYYRSMEKAVRGGHRFMTEKAVFASWAKLTPKIYFHQPDWN